MRSMLLLSVFSYFILLSGCRKLDSHYYKGKVTDESTGEPIENATVILQYWNYAGKGEYMYDSVYTDSQGNFVFNHRKHRFWSYRMWARAAGYGNSGQLDLTHVHPKPPYDLTLRPSAWFRLHVKKHTSSVSKISIFASDGFQFSSATTMTPTSYPPYDTLLQPVTATPNTSISISWTITTYSPSILISDSSKYISIPTRGTVTVNIDYN